MPTLQDGGAKKDIEISDQESSASEEEPESLLEVEPSPEETTPANPLKEVANEAVVMLFMRKTNRVVQRPCSQWSCHQSHEGCFFFSGQTDL